MHAYSFSPCISFCGVGDSSFQMCSSQKTPSINTINLEARIYHGLKIGKSRDIQVQHSKGTNDRIRKALLKVDLSVSSYDTAWVAMVSSPSSPQFPCFPECIDWILQNQNPDGSWGLPHCPPSLIKCIVTSTMACVLALKRWNVGEEHVKRGLHFIGSNFLSTMNEKLQSPIGFDIIFPGMIVSAIEMGLDLGLRQTDIDALINMRDLELQRLAAGNSEGREAYLAYVAEGLGELQNWKEIKKYQKKNGSIFNSPSTTAAAFIHTRDEKASNYLHSLLQKFGTSVPTVHPLEMYTLLRVVDNLERLGISQYFSCEIKIILDRVYRCWVRNDEEVTSDITTCALAFRILRLNGYDISSDPLAPFAEADQFYKSVQGHLKDVNSVLELYRASQIRILPNEQVLEKLNSWTSHYLREKLSTNCIQKPDLISREVDYALKFPFYANLERLEHKRNIECYNVESFQLLKTPYMNHSINNNDLLQLAIKDFNFCQSIHRKELEHLESWVKENKLDQLEFTRQKLTYCYFSTAATLFPLEMSDARISWAKNGVLTTVVDDFFDVGGSREELANLISLVQKWDGNLEKDFCSEQVKIVFTALYCTINELGAKASALQKHNITSHIIDIWLRLMESMMKEAEWLRNKSVPTFNEYMANGYVSFALGPIILPALYFVGPKISKDVIEGPECQSLYKLVSTCGRLLNDVQGFEREGKEGKLNSMSLRILHSDGSVSENEAKKENESVIISCRMELLRLVLLEEGSVVPRACKDLFWKMCKVLHLFYMRNDGFTSPKEMVAAVNAVIHERLKVDHLQLSADA